MDGLFRIVSCLGLLGLAGLLTGCSQAAGPAQGPGKPVQSQVLRETRPAAAEADLQALVSGNTAFALDFAGAQGAARENQAFSPYSLSTALAMTYAGARGATAEQMAQVLHFDLPPERLHPAFNALDMQISAPVAASDKSRPFQLSVANSLWGQDGYAFQPQFLDLLALNYGAGLQLVDFRRDPEAGRGAINGWVEQQTEQRIKDLVPQGGLGADTRLVLVNAIYFLADWLYPFERNNTHELPFTRLDGSQTQAPMMSYEHPQVLPFLRGVGYSAVELPYVGGQAVMLLLVPDPGQFDAFRSSLDAARLQDILAGLQPQPVSLVAPRFKVESTYRLADALAEMGMPDAFCSSPRVDFSGMTGKPDLCIGQVFQKAFVAVDEKGTEAAAASAVVAKELALMISDAQSLVIDRPFLFAILHKPDNSVLFWGQVTDPTR